MSASPEPLRIFFLDVGQGDCTFIVPPKAECAPILFDCADLYVAERFVANHEITDLAAVVASHFDLDHIRGMHSFLQTHFGAGRRVQRLVMFPDRVPRAGRNGALRQLMAAALTWEQEPPHPGFVLKASHRDGDGPLLLGEGEGWRVELVLPMPIRLPHHGGPGGPVPGRRVGTRTRAGAPGGCHDAPRWNPGRTRWELPLS